MNKLLVTLLVGIGYFGLARFEVVLAEPQFGGDVSGVIRCTCGSNAGGVYFEVDDPHGNDTGGHGEYVASPGVERDCAPINNGEEALGMHNENDEDCKIQIGNACVTIASGKGVDIYGSSATDDCDTGLYGDASGDSKTEMMTPDGRTADGGDEDDGGPSGGPSQATQSDAHLATVDGVKADGSGGAVHMTTPDNQNEEGDGTTHMETSDHRNYEGNNDSVLTSSGKGSGYSQAGAGRPGDGYGSVGGSVGSGGLQSPVVLGNKDQKKEMPKKTKATKKLDIAASYNIQETTTKELMLKLLIVIGGIGGAGYFVSRAVGKVFKNHTQNN